MSLSRIEIRLSQNCGDAGLAQIRDVIREKALRPPGSSGLVFIVPTGEAEVMIDTNVRRLNISPELVAALQCLDAVSACVTTHSPTQAVA
ncbi:hypothetical protein IC232_03680 [Microvirga sp. BT688]|uniref:hypothetical protein n=1 Tax=Microvirga sp. TaxID=1873136 RepID=UPI00168448D3|nr:hypothetical protein [Microvirga sp.]MBD2745791.1 hypothetical protein [Microvirga sp.]